MNDDLIRKANKAIGARYIEKIIEGWRREGSPKGVFISTVCHDDWCALLAGKGPCNCNPEVNTAPAGEGE
jgi:hypothetical protein